MQTRKHFVDDYHAATRAETALWEKVKGHGPGQPGFNRDLWMQWLEAVARTTNASKALREAFADDSKAGDLN